MTDLAVALVREGYDEVLNRHALQMSTNFGCNRYGRSSRYEPENCLACGKMLAYGVGQIVYDWSRGVDLIEVNSHGPLILPFEELFFETRGYLTLITTLP